MSNPLLPQHHASETELLFYLDGELSLKKTLNVKSHLERCWRCRARATELQGAITRFMHFLDSDYAHGNRPPRLGWEDSQRLVELVPANNEAVRPALTVSSQSSQAVAIREAGFWSSLRGNTRIDPKGRNANAVRDK
jgi:anti-sigma factor RsiW